MDRVRLRCPLRSRHLFALLVGALVLPAPALAQGSGVWWSVSAAAAGARLACDVCDPTRDAGPAVEVAVGTYATPITRIGIDAGAWTFRDEDFRERVYTAGIVAEVHPRSGSGLHLIGGLGWTGYRAGDIDAPPEDQGFHYNAVRLRLGVGWDFPLGGSWTVGNRVTVDASSLGTLSDEGTPVASAVGLSLVRVGIFLRHR